MIQAPYKEYCKNPLLISIGDPQTGTPIDPNNLQQVIGNDLYWNPAVTTPQSISLYPAADKTAINFGGVGQGQGLDTGLKVLDVVNDPDGDPWFKVQISPDDFGGQSVAYVPALQSSVPNSQAGSFIQLNAGQPAAAGTGSQQQQGTQSTTQAQGSKTGTGKGGGGFGFLGADTNLGLNNTEKWGLGLVLAILIGVGAYTLAKAD